MAHRTETRYLLSETPVSFLAHAGRQAGSTEKVHRDSTPISPSLMLKANTMGMTEGPRRGVETEAAGLKSGPGDHGTAVATGRSA